MKTRWVSSSVILIVLVSGTLCTTAAQQPQERVIRRMPAEQNEPLEITDIKVNGQSVSFDKKFVADDDWMRSLVVMVKNKSDKRILFASIELFFSRPPDAKVRAMFDLLSYGNWALQNRRLTPGEQLIGIAPGETVEIGFSVQKFAELTRFLTEAGCPQSIEKVDLRFGSVIFEDDTMWRGGFFRRDPSNSSNWINVSP